MWGLIYGFDFFSGDARARAEKLIKECSRLKGAMRVAAYAVACSTLASVMANEEGLYYVGQAFEFFCGEGLLLADVHLGNIGLLDQERWGITDPGHMVPLDPRWLSVEIPTLPA